ncbi:MAG: hypothetical protein UD936_00755 [Acutalibacteraceae bacterium]|nr:hypothetical protein [Acutalibacteraceae bacterium]
MLGLRTQESKKFENFIELVQNKASEENCIFFVDAGDGRDFDTDEMEGEDLSGWLIPVSKASEFTPIWKTNDVNDDWTDFFCFAIWKQVGNKLTVSFEFM